MRSASQILDNMHDNLEQLRATGHTGNAAGVEAFLESAAEDIKELARVYNSDINLCDCDQEDY